MLAPPRSTDSPADLNCDPTPFGRHGFCRRPTDVDMLPKQPAAQMNRPVALQRCDTFVGRTMNWIYDHLRSLPDYEPRILADRLANREEFPDLAAYAPDHAAIGRRLWRRFGGRRPYPGDRRFLARQDIRVLHSHFGYVAEGDLELRRWLERPWLIGYYGADVYLLGRTEEWRDRYVPVFSAADRILALGPNMSAALEELGCPAEKIVVHPMGVDVASIPSAVRRKGSGEELIVLFAGTFREKKGVEYLIEAAHLARSSGVRFHLHLVGDQAGRPGDAETKEAVFRLIASLGLEGMVTHHSWLAFHELIELALRAHVFVAPSVTAEDGDAEGTPFVIQQMMATGMPVISTVHSDIPFVFGGCANLLVPERDATAIARRIEEYADDPDRIVRDGQAMREQISAHLDVRHCAAQLARLYSALDAS